MSDRSSSDSRAPVEAAGETPGRPRPRHPLADPHILVGALLPALLFSLGVGAMLPVIASFAVERGASLATAGAIAAMLPVGQILADMPAGSLTARIGDRRAMLLAGLLGALGFLGAALSPGPLSLAAAVLLVGGANAVFHLARHAHLTAVTPPQHRARVLSTLGGMNRIGQFLGPFLGAAVLLVGELPLVFVVAAVTALAASATVAMTREDPQTVDDDGAAGVGAAQSGRAGRAQSAEASRAPRMLEVLRDHRRLLMTLGVPVLLVGSVRGARQQVLPLWGEHLGLDPATISLLFGLAAGVDMLLFYPAGKIMDRMGRLWIGVPSMTLLGLAMALVPLTSGESQLAAAAVLMGLGNGLGSGIMMTIASDVAPERGRPQFLGAWRLLQDVGVASGPLIVSAGAALGSLAAGIWTAAAMGPAGAAALRRWLPRWSIHATRATRRRAEQSAP
ncbi:MFS transporter [Nesterenkonia halobia]|uniref:MFS transporter n=1 Tax=Nesterenkonia halobia TaxID=37922 RepID=A0ABP6RFS6_9MICC